MVDRERYARIPSQHPPPIHPPTHPPPVVEASTMFLSCGRYQRNQLPGNTREFQAPASCPRSGKLSPLLLLKQERGISRWRGDGGEVEHRLAVAHIYFILAAPYRPGTDGILYQVEPRARRTPPFSFARRSISPVPAPSRYSVSAYQLHTTGPHRDFSVPFAGLALRLVTVLYLGTVGIASWELTKYRESLHVSSFFGFSFFLVITTR